MFMRMPYEVLRERYPNEVTAIETAIRLSKAKSKNDPFESFEWGFNWGVRIEGGTLANLLSKREEAPKSLDERVADYATRCLVTITASKGRGRWYSGMVAAPTELLDAERQRIQEADAERARVEALSTEEREAELEQALSQLRGKPGFVELRVPRKGGR